MSENNITGIKGLYIKPIEIEDSNKYNNYIESVYNLSITLYEYITKQFENQLGETLEDFWWLRTAATRPAFHHLCFNCKGYVYSCLIGFLENNEIKVLGQDWNNFMRETENNALNACIIPIEFKNEDSIRVHAILDAKTLKPTQFNMTNTYTSISEWEMYCMGVNEVVLYLMNKEYTDIQYCDIPSINPSIWFVDENGQRSYVVVRSVPMGLDKEPYTINKSFIDEYKSNTKLDMNINWESIYYLNNGRLEWLEFNIKRSLMIDSDSKEEQELGIKEVKETIEHVLYYDKIKDIILEVLK
jgi:hypothetical protein